MNRDLNSVIPGAPNFKYREFVKSDTAIRLGISNTPNKDQWRNIEVLARNILQPLRDKFGRLRITSGFRSEELNKAINGAIPSDHCTGEAADVEPIDTNISLVEIVTWINKNLPYKKLVCEYFPNGWVHISYSKGGNKKILLAKDSKHNYNRIDISTVQTIYA